MLEREGAGQEDGNVIDATTEIGYRGSSNMKKNFPSLSPQHALHTSSLTNPTDHKISVDWENMSESANSKNMSDRSTTRLMDFIEDM